jgi:hypothetical protein
MRRFKLLSLALLLLIFWISLSFVGKSESATFWGGGVNPTQLADDGSGKGADMVGVYDWMTTRLGAFFRGHYVVKQIAGDQGAVGTVGTLAYLINHIGAADATINLAGDYTYNFTTSATVPANINLVIEKGALLNPSITKVITFYSPSNISSPLQQIFTGAGTESFTDKGTIYPEWWGTNGLNLAIPSLAAGGCISFKGGLYALTAGVSATLAGPQNWVAESPVTIQYTGAEITNMVLLTLGYNKLTMKGPFIFDANNDARFALRINNDTPSMSNATDVILEDVKAINAYSTDVVGHIGSVGIFIYGGFNKVTLTNCGASNISRDAGVGTPGVSGSVGIGITENGTGITGYPKQVEIINPYIDTVTSLEPDGGGNNVDCDGVAVMAPRADENSGVKLSTFLTVRGGRIRNCRGRSIKSQMEDNLVDGPVFIRDAAAKRSISNGLEVDFQNGNGTLINFKCHYAALSGGGTPFGASFALVQVTVRNLGVTSGRGEGSVIIKNGDVIIDYSAAAMPYFLLPATTDAAARFSSINIESVNITGEGSVNNFVYGDLSKIKSLTVKNNFFTRFASSLIYTTASAESCIAVLQNNFVAYTTTAVLWNAAAGLPPTLKNPFGNNYFNGYTSSPEGEGVSLVDDASYIFAPRESGTFNIYVITSNINHHACGIFAHDGAALDLTGGVSTSIAYGDAVNPDTDGKLNVWRDANGCINIKNRAGSTRKFSLSVR